MENTSESVPASASICEPANTLRGKSGLFSGKTCEHCGACREMSQVKAVDPKPAPSTNRFFSAVSD